MTLTEALKSGKAFRRPKHSPDWIVDNQTEYFVFTAEDLLADDWYIKEYAVTITASQFTAAWANAVKDAMISTSPDYERIIYQQLKKELGL